VPTGKEIENRIAAKAACRRDGPNRPLLRPTDSSGDTAIAEARPPAARAPKGQPASPPHHLRQKLGPAGSDGNRELPRMAGPAAPASLADLFREGTRGPVSTDIPPQGTATTWSLPTAIRAAEGHAGLGEGGPGGGGGPEGNKPFRRRV